MATSARALSEGYLRQLDALYKDNPSHAEAFSGLYPGLIELLKERQEAHQKASLAQEQKDSRDDKDALLLARRYLRESLLRTAQNYREQREDFYLLRRGRYNRLSYLKRSAKRNEQTKQNRWDKFTVNVLETRLAQALNWIDRRHAGWITTVITSGDVFELATDWPDGSACAIDLVMSPNWVPIEPPDQPLVVTVERSLRQRLAAYERALLEMQAREAGFKKPHRDHNYHD